MNMKETLFFIMQLIKDTFSAGGSYRKEMQKLEVSLGTRAWLTFSILSLTRVVYFISGIAIYQTVEDDNAKIEGLNEDFVRKTETTVKYAIIVMLVLGVLSNVVIYRYRRCAKWIIYYELVFLILTSLIPKYQTE